VGQFISRKRPKNVLSRSEARFRALTELSSDCTGRATARSVSSASAAAI